MAKFTAEDDRIILHMKDHQHVSWQSIGRRLGRVPSVCAHRYHVLTQDGTKGPIKSIAEIEEARFQGKLGERMIEREARHQAKLARDEADAARGVLTAHFLGDPEPGRSALDQRRAHT